MKKINIEANIKKPIIPLNLPLLKKLNSPNTKFYLKKIDGLKLEKK